MHGDFAKAKASTKYLRGDLFLLGAAPFAAILTRKFTAAEKQFDNQLRFMTSMS
jgi:hypothetical protein